MLADMILANEINIEYHKYLPQHQALETPKIIESNVKVLCKAHWPTYKNFPLKIPLQLIDVQQSFTDYYNSKNNFRSLEWIYSLSSIIVEARFEKGTHEVTMSMPQYVIISYLETKNDEASFNELLEETKLDEDTLKKNLHSMCFMKFKLIEKGTPENKTIGLQDMFKICTNFSNAHRKFTLAVPKYEENYNKEKIQEDRGMAIEAAIVRIMKTRRALEYQDLQQEVYNLLKQFTPDTKQIKTKIEHLIEKEFIERDQTNKNLFKYLA